MKNIINNLLKEVEVSRNNVLSAIKNQTPVIVQKFFNSGEKEGITSENVIITNIDDNNVVSGKTSDGQIIQFGLEDILTSLTENVDFTGADSNAIKKINAAGGNKGINVSAAKIDNMDTAKVGDLLKKADEAKVDINLTEQSENENNLKQKQTIENLLSWTNSDSTLSISSQKIKGENIINYTIFINKTPIETYIYPTGELKIGGHSVKDVNTFKNIISFYKDNL